MATVFVLLFITLAILWALVTILLFVFGISQFTEWEWIMGIICCILGTICLIITIAFVIFIFTVLI
jgi:hypothetical protein